MFRMLFGLREFGILRGLGDSSKDSRTKDSGICGDYSMLYIEILIQVVISNSVLLSPLCIGQGNHISLLGSIRFDRRISLH